MIGLKINNSFSVVVFNSPLRLKKRVVHLVQMEAPSLWAVLKLACTVWCILVCHAI